MAQPRGEQALQSIRPDSTPTARAVLMARAIHTIVSDARKTPAEYVRLWNVPGGAE